MNSKLSIYRFFLVFVFFLMASFPGHSFAEKLVTNLEQGQRAPFKGILLSPLAYSDLESEVIHSREKFQLELDYKVSLERALAETKYDALLAFSEADRRAKSEILELKRLQINQLSESLTAAEQRSEFMFKFGIVVGAATAIVVVILFNQIRQ